MGYFDLINELRNGKPDVRKAARAMKILGWLCLLGAFSNGLFLKLLPKDTFPFAVSLSDVSPFLLLMFFAGLLFLYAARGIARMEPWGRKAGQIALAMLTLAFMSYMYSMFTSPDSPFGTHGNMPPVFKIFMIVVSAQFLVPAFYGIRYLGRLPVNEYGLPGPRHEPELLEMSMAQRAGQTGSGEQKTYKEVMWPFGSPWALRGMLVLLFATGFLLFRFIGPLALFYLMFPAMLFMFLGPVIYNLLPSRFEEGRDALDSHTGGGSVSIVNATWPLVRLIIYHDGLEMRFFFHRFFVPYDRMEDLPEIITFFSNGIRIKTDLPDIPFTLRFSGFGMKEILQTIHETRSRYLEGKGNQSP